MKYDLDKTLKISVIAGVSLIAFSIFFYLVVFLPYKEIKREKEFRQVKLEECLKEAKEAQIKYAKPFYDAVIGGYLKGDTLKFAMEEVDKMGKERDLECQKKYGNVGNSKPITLPH